MGGARQPPFITFTITSKVAVYAPAEWPDTIKVLRGKTVSTVKAVFDNLSNFHPISSFRLVFAVYLPGPSRTFLPFLFQGLQSF